MTLSNWNVGFKCEVCIGNIRADFVTSEYKGNGTDLSI